MSQNGIEKKITVSICLHLLSLEGKADDNLTKLRNNKAKVLKLIVKQVSFFGCMFVKTSSMIEVHAPLN